ncbi:sensor histidine kinase [Nocardia crassostreae]|uniref:sensor histidine kinase n=1 Tax=Nocardia crassostreae TaxID=53428 RepID=UPI0012F8C0F0|nr:histidine kinase [Nocardia crassostreae]
MTRLIRADVRPHWWPLVFAATVVLGAALFGIVMHTLMSDTGLSDRRSLGLALAQALAVVLAPRLPVLAWACSMAAVVLASAWVDTGLWVDAMVNSYLIVLGVIALTVPARHAAAYWVATMTAALGWAVVLRPPSWPPDLLDFAALTALVLIAGAAVRGLAVARRGLREQQRLVTRQRERNALLEERTRIARELHDVVAHHMSVIDLQAEAAPFRDPDSAPQTFAAIRESAVTALTEMRRILGVLRSADTGTAPPPTLADLGEMVELVRRTGTRIDLEATGDLAAAPPAIGLSAYRIVQEALSNAVRHAPGDPIRARIALDDTEIRIDIDNPLTAATRAATQGHGLTGMRERAAAFGGSFAAGPTADGRFTVAVTLPLREAR